MIDARNDHIEQKCAHEVMTATVMGTIAILKVRRKRREERKEGKEGKEEKKESKEENFPKDRVR